MSGMADPCPRVALCRSQFTVTISVAPLAAVLDALVAVFLGVGGSFVFFWFVGCCGGFFFIQAPSVGFLPKCILGFPFC